MRNTTPISELVLQNHSESAIISAVFRLAYKQKKALALWQLPDSKTKHLIVDLSDEIIQGKVDLEESPSGFLFSPFKNTDGTQSYFVKAHLHITLGTEQPTIHQDPETKDVLDDLRVELENEQKESPVFHNTQQYPPVSAESYQEIIREAIKEIAAGSFLKVVPSVVESLKLKEDFNCLDTFFELSMKYSQAFISLVSIPQVGAWMGASPEPIIEVDKHKIFSTAALAGTQSFDPQIPLREVAWRQKEIEEQALVSRYIINCFKKIRLREFEEVGPRTVIAGNLLHLKSTYRVDLQATNFPQLGTVMLDLLHPTSAVCGMPQIPAFHFLETHETFDRAFFSGFLGPVNVLEETHCFVNLRCMQMHGDSATLYAGAGVTADSNPEREWKETQLKFDTLLAVLKAKSN